MRTILAAALLSASLAVGCALVGGSGPDDGPRASARADSIQVIVRNDNYLGVNVRLFSRGAFVEKIWVPGHSSDSVFLRSGRLGPPADVTAHLDPVGSRSGWWLPEQMVPVDTRVIHIDVAELLSTSALYLQD